MSEEIALPEWVRDVLDRHAHVIDRQVLLRLTLGRHIQGLATELESPDSFAEPSGFPDDHQLSDKSLLRSQAETSNSFGLWLAEHKRIRKDDFPAVIAIARFRQLRENLYDAAEMASALPAGENVLAAQAAIEVAINLHGQMDNPALWHLMDGEPDAATDCIIRHVERIAESCLTQFRMIGAKLNVEAERLPRHEENAVEPIEAETLPPNPLDQFRNAITNEIFGGVQQKIIDTILSAGGKVGLDILIGVMPTWDDEGPWKSAARDLNKKLRPRGWEVAQDMRHAIIREVARGGENATSNATD